MLDNLSRLDENNCVKRKVKSRDVQTTATIAKTKLLELKENIGDIDKLFVGFDTHRRGKISYEEFSQTLLVANSGLEKHETKSLATKLDKKKAGSVEYASILSALQEVENLPVGMQRRDDYQKNHEESISRPQIKEFYSKPNFPQSQYISVDPHQRIIDAQADNPIVMIQNLHPVGAITNRHPTSGDQIAQEPPSHIQMERMFYASTGAQHVPGKRFGFHRNITSPPYVIEVNARSQRRQQPRQRPRSAPPSMRSGTLRESLLKEHKAVGGNMITSGTGYILIMYARE